MWWKCGIHKIIFGVWEKDGWQWSRHAWGQDKVSDSELMLALIPNLIVSSPLCTFFHAHRLHSAPWRARDRQSSHASGNHASGHRCLNINLFGHFRYLNLLITNRDLNDFYANCLACSTCIQKVQLIMWTKLDRTSKHSWMTPNIKEEA